MMNKMSVAAARRLLSRDLKIEEDQARRWGERLLSFTPKKKTAQAAIQKTLLSVSPGQIHHAR